MATVVELLADAREVVAPAAAAVGLIDAREKRRNDLAQLCRASDRRTSRTSASGWARIRSSSASNAWPVPKMPTFDCVAAGSMPRSVSSAFARMAARCTPSESAGDFGYRRAKCSCIGGIHFA